MTQAKGVILFVCITVIQAQRDLTLVPEASGSDVVRAVVSKIESVFPTDHRLLRRIAYVESLDGEETRTYREEYDGGIWQVDLATFIDTQNLSAHPGLDSLHSKIKNNFGIDWQYVNWKDLRIPLYSGLALRIYFWIIGKSIPLAGEITAQAVYWRAIYNHKETEKDFVTMVVALEKKEDCHICMDFIFVLDSSGSIGSDNYQTVREFVKNFIISGITIGPDDDQVGVIIFGSSAQVVFDLNTYQEQAQLLGAINSIPYLDQSTNTAAALRKLIDEGFTESGGARLDSKTILRVAIVMTDGKSNVNSSDTPLAAARVHDFKPSILVYAVGVTNGINQKELNDIATSPEFVNNLDSFDTSLLREYQEELYYDICVKASLPANVGEVLNRTLGEGEQTRFQLDIPEEGITVRLSIQVGQLVLYASTKIPNPNSAYYDWKLECADCDGCDFFVDPRDLQNMQISVEDGKQKYQVNESESEVVNSTLYVVAEGLEADTIFMIETAFGDTSTPKGIPSSPKGSPVTSPPKVTPATTVNEVYEHCNALWIVVHCNGECTLLFFVCILSMIVNVCCCIRCSCTKR